MYSIYSQLTEESSKKHQVHHWPQKSQHRRIWEKCISEQLAGEFWNGGVGMFRLLKSKLEISQLSRVRGKASPLSKLSLLNCISTQKSKLKWISVQLIKESGRKPQEDAYYWPVLKCQGTISGEVHGWLALWQSVSLISSLKWKSTSLITSLKREGSQGELYHWVLYWGVRKYIRYWRVRSGRSIQYIWPSQGEQFKEKSKWSVSLLKSQKRRGIFLQYHWLHP